MNQWIKKYREHLVKGLEDKRDGNIPAEEKELTEADITKAGPQIEKKKNREIEVEIAVLKKARKKALSRIRNELKYNAVKELNEEKDMTIEELRKAVRISNSGYRLIT